MLSKYLVQIRACDVSYVHITEQNRVFKYYYTFIYKVTHLELKYDIHVTATTEVPSRFDIFFL